MSILIMNNIIEIADATEQLNYHLKDIIANQNDLPSDFKEILSSNFWELM